MTDTKAIAIRLLDKEYRIGCPEGEEEQLLATGRFLDKRMKEIRTSGKVIGTERIAVMAALNLAHELLTSQHGKGEHADAASRRVRGLRDKIEAALNESAQLDL